MIDFERRLKSLKDRRQGTQHIAALEANFTESLTYDMREHEAYERLAESSGVKYAIGAMSPVSQKSTDICIEEGNRVADTLISMLSTSGIEASKAMQGSVPLDIHIEGHSDVDMLIILQNTILIETPTRPGTNYSPCKDNRPVEDQVQELRISSENKLVSRYHQADVDCSNNKSISLENGSLQRKVDIVPSCYYHSHTYQDTEHEHEKGIHIYHKSDHELIGNFPFKHIHNVNLKDQKYSGNLKRVIRLMKNVVADMPDYKKIKAKKLSSYDLAGIAYHMNESLSVPNYQLLSLVEKTRVHLEILSAVKEHRESLDVPDKTRKIFNSLNKEEALRVLLDEVDNLAKSIYRELQPDSFSPYNANILTEKSVILQSF